MKGRERDRRKRNRTERPDKPLQRILKDRPIEHFLAQRHNGRCQREHCTVTQIDVCYETSKRLRNETDSRGH